MLDFNKLTHEGVITLPQEQSTNPKSPLDAISNHRRRWIALFFVAVIAAAALIFVLVNVSEISGFAVQAANAEPAWLAAAALSQLFTYLCVAFIWKRILSSANHPISIRSLYPLAIAKMFSDQAIPSGGVAGAALVFHALGRRGAPYRLGFTVFTFTAISFFAAFLIAAIISLYALTTTGDQRPILTNSIAGFAVLTLLLIICGILIFTMAPNKTPRWLNKIPYYDDLTQWITTALQFIRTERRLFFEATFTQLIVRLIDGLTLFLSFLAISALVPYQMCFFAVTIASITATMAPTPMGLGSFEAGMIATLNVFGVSIENALTATLIFRGLSLWLPLIPGFYIIQREILQQKPQPI